VRLRRCLICLLCLPLLLGGCWDYRELEELSYLMAVGIDKGQKERLAVTFVLSRPKGGKDEGGGKKDEGGKGDKESGIITVEAPTVSGAIFYLNTIATRPTSLAQTKLYLLSERLARTDGLAVLDESVRNRDVRRSSIIVVTRQPVRELLKGFKSDPTALDDFASITATKESRRSGFMPTRASLNDLLIRSATTYEESVAFYATLPDPSAKKDDKSDQKVANKAKEHRLTPGASRRQGGPAVDFFGAAAFRKTKMVGVLDAEDTRVMLIIDNTFRNSNMEVADPSDPSRQIGVRLELGRPTKVSAALDPDGRPRFQIKISLDAQIAASPSKINYSSPEARAQVEAAVAAELKKQVEAFFKKTQAWGSDVAGLGRHVVRKLPTVEAWERYNWPSHYKDAETNVTVRVELRRYGVQMNPTSRGGRGLSE
jgi:spore germination protein KC